MTKLKLLFQSFGLFTKLKFQKPYNYDVNKYTNSKERKLELHKTYLKEIENEENKRLNIIENKTSQLISQTGLIFSLLSLFIPFIIDKVLDLNVILKILFIIVLVFAYLFYILTINNAIKNFNVKNFKYGKNSPNSILSQQELSIKKFMIMEIKDSLITINNNIAINNVKATNLISAFNSFRFGNILTSMLVVFLCFSLLFLNSKREEIEIRNPIEIKQFNEYIEALNEQNRILIEERKTEKAELIEESTINDHKVSNKNQTK